jgi:hypothetical protein
LIGKADLTSAAWCKSSYSSGGANCVEVAFLNNTVAIRDSKNPDGPVLLFTSKQHEAFIQGLKTDD